MALNGMKAGVIHMAGKVPLLSHGLRWVANRYAEGSVTKIRAGHAVGMKWKRYHRYVNGYWLGQYELAMQEAIWSHLEPGDTFFDVGANAGFFSLVAAARVGAAGKVIAFEPLPGNAAVVREQFALNALSQCKLLQVAVSDQAGQATFHFQQGAPATPHLGAARRDEESIQVPLSTLDGCVEKYGRPTVIKMDIEGAEVKALEGAKELLQGARKPVWLIETHGEEAEQGVQRILREAKYTFHSLEGSRLADSGRWPTRHVLAKVVS